MQVEPHEVWPLTHTPIASTIRVFIDGQLNWDWSYDSASNSVVFSVIPAGGDHVDIGYVIDETTGDTGN